MFLLVTFLCLIASNLSEQYRRVFCSSSVAVWFMCKTRCHRFPYSPCTLTFVTCSVEFIWSSTLSLMAFLGPLYFARWLAEIYQLPLTSGAFPEYLFFRDVFLLLWAGTFVTCLVSNSSWRYLHFKFCASVPLHARWWALRLTRVGKGSPQFDMDGFPRVPQVHLCTFVHG